MTTNPYNQYKQQSVMTASPGDLTLMLYDGCIKQMKLAKIYITDKKIWEKNNCLQKAQDIISELMKTLDFTYEISGQLFNLYEFILRQLVNANIKNDIDLIDEAIAMVTDIRDAWAEATKIDRKVAYNE